MSGKDVQTFITSFKAEDVEKLTVRMKNGLGSSKYKPAEYKRLLAIVDAKRQETELIGQKVHKTCCAAKATKESSILCQHRQVWSTECLRLQKAEEKTENEIQDFIKQIRPNNITDSGIFSLQEYELFLERERETFRINTVEPVYQLRDDLYFRLGEVQHQQLSAHPSNWEQVIQQINFVKAQQDDIITKLHAEYLDLEEEIASLGLQKYLTSTSDNLMNVPKEVLNSDCPYPELKDSLIEAFHSLSERYQSRLRSLQEQLQRTDRFCGWCQQDHERFQFTVSRYTSDIPNHRALCMDMLLRLFPEKSRQELSPPGDLTLQSVNAAADLGAVTLLSVYCRHSAVDASTHTLEHEGVWDLQRFTQAQLRAVTQQWQRDHEGLLARAQVTLQEANNAHQEELELHRDRQHRQDICLHLREKSFFPPALSSPHSDTAARQDGFSFRCICLFNALVSAAAPSDPNNSPDSTVQQWRAQQEEVAKLEAAIAARQQEEEEARLRREREKEGAIRSQQKEKVRQFYLKQQKRREVLEQRDQERLANLRSVMEEQARRDKERVQFRANMLQQRRLEKEVRELEQQREEQERQNRLESLRNQVGVVAEADPERMMADTEAWKSRHLNVNDFELQKPLYSINTYTDTQIVSDPRVRVEQALREADLHHSQYAREALSVIKPPKPPRRDTRSILKF